MNKRSQVSKVTARSLYFAFFGVILGLCTVSALDQAVAGNLIERRAFWAGVAILGFPLCWIFRRRTWYGAGYIAEVPFAWLFFCVGGGSIALSMVAFINKCGAAAEPRLELANVQAVRWNPRHHAYIMYFEVERIPDQHVWINDKEAKLFQPDAQFYIQLRTGFLGFDQIENYWTPNQTLKPDPVPVPAFSLPKFLRDWYVCLAGIISFSLGYAYCLIHSKYDKRIKGMAYAGLMIGLLGTIILVASLTSW